MINFLFIYILPPQAVSYTNYNSGIASLSAVLKQKGHHTRLLLFDSFNRKKLDSIVEQQTPDIIGYSFPSLQMGLAKKIIGYMGQRHKIPSIVGGVHATVAPLECLNVEGVLGVCVGEAETALANFVEAHEAGLDYFNTSNFIFKQKDKVITNPIDPLIQDIDSLPFPDRMLFDYDPNRSVLGLEFMFSRGCPLACSFCINSYLRKLYKGKGSYVRFRSPKSVVDEIEKTINLYNYKGALTFHDDVFTTNKAWLKEFAEKYKEKIKLPYVCNSTADRVDEETAQYLKNSNCKEVWFGIETGFEKIRRTVLNKNIRDEDIIRAGKILNEFGISPVSYNMLGVPGETEENIKQLIRLNRNAGVKSVSVSFMQPFPGTKIYDEFSEINKKQRLSPSLDNLRVRSKGIGNINISNKLLYKHYFLFKQNVFGGKYLWIFNLLFNFHIFLWMRRQAQLLPSPVKNFIRRVIMSS